MTAHIARGRGAPWRLEEDELLHLMYPGVLTQDIAELLGRSRFAVHARARQLGIAKDAAFVAAISRETTLARSLFGPEIREIIELLYADMVTPELAQLIGIPVTRVHAFANARGLKKSRQAIARIASDRTRARIEAGTFVGFPKGHQPANKGLRRPGWSTGRMAETQFKKGEMPHTWKPIGSHRINSDGYLDRKVSDTGYPPSDWQPVHRLVWIAANGPIPSGHIVRFKPGMQTTDSQLLTVDRVECISRREHAMRNVWHANQPPELRQLTGMRIALVRQINKAQRRLEGASNEQ